MKVRFRGANALRPRLCKGRLLRIADAPNWHCERPPSRTLLVRCDDAVEPLSTPNERPNGGIATKLTAGL